MTNLSFRWRIFLSYFVLIALASGGIGAFAARQIQEANDAAFFDGFEEKGEIVGDTINDLLVEQIEAERDDLNEITLEIDELAERLEVDVVLAGVDGDFVVYDSGLQRGDFYREPDVGMISLLETDESFREEDEEAERVYRAQYLFFEDDPLFIVSVSESWDGLDQAIWNQQVALLGATTGIGLLLLLGMGSWLVNGLMRPLTALRGTAQAMAAGELAARAETDGPTEIRLLAQDFNQMANAVEEMVGEQRAFASNAAHELRTPLTAIRLRTETLLEDEPDEALQRRYVNEIHLETQRLSRLVEDLRFLSQSDANVLAIGQESVDVELVLDGLAFEFERTLAQKKLRYDVTLPTEPIRLQASRVHVRVVLRNLLENGVKYTPENGRISLTVEQDETAVQFNIVDTGIGISEEELPKLFTRFYRVDKARNRKIPGSGLGLSLVQAIVSLYGGTILVKSDGVGQGTAVTVRWPIRQAE